MINSKFTISALSVSNKDLNSFAQLIQLWKFLSNYRKKQLFLVFFTMVLSGLSEAFSLAAVIPFLNVITNPSGASKTAFGKIIVSIFGIINLDSLILISTIVFILAAIISAFIKLLNLRLTTFISASIGSDLSFEAYKRSLYKNYELHLKTNSSEIIATATTHILRTVGTINNLLLLITSTIIAFSIVLAIFIIDWKVALNILFLFSFSYFLIAFFLRRKLNKYTKIIVKRSNEQVKSLQEGLGSIREVILSNSYSYYLKNYKFADISLRRTLAKTGFISAFPRYTIESIGLIAIALFALFLSTQEIDSKPVIPLLGTLALAAQRLLPATQQIYSNWAGIKSNSGSLKCVLDILSLSEGDITHNSKLNNSYILRNSIIFKNVEYKYEKNSQNIIKGINVEIFASERIGIIGTTGSGKTTFCDLLMSLLKPTKGEIIVDGKNIFEDDFFYSWRQSIAHVPQKIYLNDSSIAENIALGIARDEINYKLVKKAARLANIAKFIDSLPQKYNSRVGERGVQLSGGQIQRIAIARAFYRKANIIIFDEATSALDKDTENQVISAIDNINTDATIIMIAHRLSTLDKCDRIFKIEEGKILEIIDQKKNK